MGAIILIIIGIAIYFIPTIVASDNQKKDFSAILLLNLFLGWTLVGWVTALVWAATKDAPQPTSKPAATPPPSVSAEVARLRELAHLRDSKQITQAEYEQLTRK